MREAHSAVALLNARATGEADCGESSFALSRFTKEMGGGTAFGCSHQHPQKSPAVMQPQPPEQEIPSPAVPEAQAHELAQDDAV
jgi:hypothetical protein